MNVKDSQKASSGAVLVISALGANLGLTLLFYAVNGLAPGSSGGAFQLLQQLLWLGAVAVLVVGLFQISQAVDEPGLLYVTVIGLIVNSLLDTVITVVGRKLEMEIGLGGQLVYDATNLLSLVSRGLLLLGLARLSMKTYAWVVPLLGTVALLTLMRTAFSLASIHHSINTDLSMNPVYRVGMPLVALFNAIAMIVGALAVKSAVSGAAHANTPALVAAAGLQPSPPAPVAPIADFLVGGILLAVGIGVTFVSLAAASNGGRYVVATGAIVVGVVRILRGFVRMARA